jgi:hypothetical protein
MKKKIIPVIVLLVVLLINAPGILTSVNYARKAQPVGEVHTGVWTDIDGNTLGTWYWCVETQSTPNCSPIMSEPIKLRS